MDLIQPNLISGDRTTRLQRAMPVHRWCHYRHCGDVVV
jgi:hypothetical protein